MVEASVGRISGRRHKRLAAASWDLSLQRSQPAALTSKVDYSKSFDEARRATDWYDLLYTGQSCQRWLCYFLVFTAVLDRAGIKSLCERLKIMPRYHDLLIQQRSTFLEICE